ncbi:hypothetical protein, partial [Aeromonas hydrophila]|uniref:hypothetical protein n=1 Tax=Aeromonas hydrophila TaxID=644 RepID=UPI001628DC0A
MKPPLIDLFNDPYNIFSYRNMTQEEIEEHKLKNNGHCFPKIKDKFLDIHSAYEAAKIAINPEDFDASIALSDKLFERIHKSQEFKALRKMMPSVIPRKLSEYQYKFSQKVAFDKIDAEINECGIFLSEEQVLFHGGSILNGTEIGDSIVIKRPLSASFCPTKATLISDRNNMIYNENALTLLHITVVNPKTKSFVFPHTRTTKARELEVLFASGATLTLRKRELISSNRIAIK